MLRMTELRKARGWSQAELARRTGMNQATVCHMEGGHFIPYASQLAKIAEALEVSKAEAAELMEVTSTDA
jgi:transcriptional regulator with XRE-family HTH domain